MKKFLGFLTLILTLPLIALASPVSFTAIDEELTLASATSPSIWIADYARPTVYVVYDETEVGNTVSATFTMEVSVDGTNWVSGYFYDFAGGSTLQTSETFTSDINYIAWFPTDVNYPFIRVKMVAVNTDWDDTIELQAYITGIK